jgi:hypothetical protein
MMKHDGSPRLIAAVGGRGLGGVHRPGSEELSRYVVELERPSLGFEGVQALAARSRAAACELSAQGSTVRFLRTILVLEDESCLLLLEAGSASAALELARRAGAGGVARVSEVIPEGSDR